MNSKFLRACFAFSFFSFSLAFEIVVVYTKYIMAEDDNSRMNFAISRACFHVLGFTLCHGRGDWGLGINVR